MTIKQKENSGNFYPVVVAIGASAGGLDALEKFFSDVEISDHVSYIVLLHSMPNQKSILAELLNKIASIPAIRVQNNEQIKPGYLYVIPENKDVRISDDHIMLDDAHLKSCNRHPIDQLFNQLAQAYKKHAVAVVLSGTGTDGTEGAKQIKQLGGLVAAQDISEAAYGEMPASVKNSQHVDFIGTARQINITLNNIFNGELDSDLLLSGKAEISSALACIFNLLKQSTSHDFSAYKHNTLIRRIKRRMLITKTTKLEDYVALLIKHSPERFNLVSELLIGVTQFFRDPSVWELLETKVLPELLAESIGTGVFRAWVAGCASGEEAYSLAILLQDVIKKRPEYSGISLQLFATDLNNDAIGKARKGHYTSIIENQISQERLSQYFTKTNKGYRVNKQIRDLVIFAPHNLISDPPFTKLDLICCRNVMIYFTEQLHEQLLAKFHYSLKEHGKLLLGTAESVSKSTPLFIPIKNKVSLFSRQRILSNKLPYKFSGEMSSFPALPKVKQLMYKKQPDDSQKIFEKFTQQYISPPAILVDQFGKILNIIGDTSAYLSPVIGKADWNIQSMVKPELKMAFQDAFLNSQQQNSVAESIISINTSKSENNVSNYVIITVTPYSVEKEIPCSVISFHSFNTNNVIPTISSTDYENRYQNRLMFLEKALNDTRNELQSTKEEMQTSREELMSTNEELQSTNEELTTSTEELRTMNEELQIARHQAEESYLQFADLFNSAPVGYFTLNRRAKILSLNQAGKSLLTDSNDDQVGSSFILYIIEKDRKFFNQHLENAFNTHTEQQCDVSLWHDGLDIRHVSITISAPSDDDHCRVIVSDITDRKQDEFIIYEQKHQLQKILDNNSDLILVTYLDKNHTVGFSFANPKFLALFNLEEADINNKPLADIPNIPAVLSNTDPLIKALKSRKAITDELTLTINNQQYIFDTSTIAIFDETSDVQQFITNFHDITYIKEQQRQIELSEARYARVLSGTNDGVWEWNANTDETYISPKFAQLLGYEKNEIAEKADILYSRLHDNDKKKFKETAEQHIQNNLPFQLDIRLKHKTKGYRWFSCKAEAVYDNSANAILLSGTISDIHRQKLLQHMEQSKNKILSMTAKNAPLQDILRNILVLLEHDQPEMLCSILLLDDSGTRLCSGVAPRLPDFYVNAVNGITIGKNVGSCGTAAFTKERVIVENIQEHPYWENYKELAAKAQLASCWSQPIINNEGKVLGTFAIYHQTPKVPTDEDIELINQQTVLAEIAIEHSIANEKLKMAALVYENSSEASMVFDVNNIVLSINPAFTIITGYEAHEIIGKNRSILYSEKHDEKFYHDIQHILDTTGKWQGELWGKKKSGSLYAQWMTISTVYDDLGRANKHIALFFDITEKKNSEQQIWQQANYDELTSLPNRRLFFDRLKTEINRTERDHNKLALLLIDLDNFKEVNDAYGHDQGDLLLKETAKRIKRCVRSTDTIARLGGDEFTLILPNIDDQQQIEATVNDILITLQQGFQLHNHEAYISGSIGITIYPDDGINKDILLKNADQAMYLAKDKGKNQFSYFTKSMQDKAQKHISLINDLRLAIKQEQFILYFQPIIDINTNKIIKAEVLIRWLHPTKGLIPPTKFIPAAEESGLILEIGDWVFKQATLQCKQWMNTIDKNFSLSINVSPIQFLHHSNQIEQWIDFINQQGIDGENIVVEITEGLLLDASPKVKKQLKLLAKHGINVSMDDFGTGYSSLSYLKKFDIDYLKIDQSFVKNMDTDRNDLALCQAIIMMAHQLGLKVIAEGVEKEQHANLLKQSNCDFIQGYLIEKPMPKSDFESFVTANETTHNALSNIKLKH